MKNKILNQNLSYIVSALSPDRIRNLTEVLNSRELALPFFIGN